MRHGMSRVIGLRQKNAAGRQFFGRQLARRYEKRYMRPRLSHVARQRKASHLTWHMDIGEQEMDCGKLRLQVTESFFRMPGFQHVKSRIRHGARDQKADERFVLRDNDRFRVH
jgi:hypothetical protein